jgi:hypothetical protein
LSTSIEIINCSIEKSIQSDVSSLKEQEIKTFKEGNGFVTVQERVAIADWMQVCSSRYKLQRHTCALSIMLFDKIASFYTQ